MLNRFRSNEGFTLIELLIVVAIIGILAAIAIPQFSAYRVKGYNSAAVSDLKNIATAEVSFGEVANGCFVSTAAGGVPGAGAILTGPTSTPIAVAIGALNTIDPVTAQSFPMQLSAGVGLGINTSAASSDYTMVTKATGGDKWYGMDSTPNAQMGSQGTTASRGVALVAGDIPAATAAANDFTGVTPAGAGAVAWIAM